nr:patatin-like phospholipase family protein [uncultured Hyphomonas sp.]
MSAYDKLSQSLELDPLGSKKLEDTIGLCLSGGGYKAAVFHLGALIRLNELGLLLDVARISSVSGGSITAAWLGVKWEELAASKAAGTSVAAGFDQLIKAPLLKFATTADIDVSSIFGGLINPRDTGAERLSDAYRKHLFGGLTLADLPAPKDSRGRRRAPTFKINATSFQHNSLWRMGREYIANYEVGLFRNPKIPLADAVAASSAFPPFLSPMKLDLRGLKVEKGTEGDLFMSPYSTQPQVFDGGAYDNLGLETVWKRCKTILVSNAGDPFGVKPSPAKDWLSQSRRVISMMHRNEENHRLRWLISMAQAGDRKVALWSLRGRHTDFPVKGTIGLPDKEAKLVHNQDVRLKPLTKAEARRLLQHGYSVADASLRCFLSPAGQAPASLPELGRF